MSTRTKAIAICVCCIFLFLSAHWVSWLPVVSLVLASLAGCIVGHLSARQHFDVALADLGLRVKQEKARVIDLKSRRVMYVDHSEEADKPLFTP